MKFDPLFVTPQWLKEYHTKYPHGMSVLENIIEWVNQTNTLIDWVNITPQKIEEILSKWNLDGTLNFIISDAITADISNLLKTSYVNVKHLPPPYTSAIGDGVTDDTQAINDAITFATTIGSRKIYIPNGTYLIDAVKPGEDPQEGNIDIPSNFELFMDQAAVLKVASNSSWGYACLNLKNVENVYIHGGTIIGDRDNHDFTTFPQWATHEWGHGVYARNVKNLTIKNLTVKKCTGDGIYVGGVFPVTAIMTENVTIESCTVDNNRRNGIVAAHGTNIKILHCTATNTIGTNPAAGIDIEGEANLDGEPFVEVDGVIIDGCYISGNDRKGIDLIKCRNITINNCLFVNQQSAITEVHSVANVVISKNIIKNDSLKIGISISSSHITIVDNIMEKAHIYLTLYYLYTFFENVIVKDNTLKEGVIQIWASFTGKNVKISGNIFQNSVSSAIGLNTFSLYANSVTISGNKIHDAVNRGISMNGSDIVISDNEIINAGEHGIYLHNGSNRSKIINNIVKSWGLTSPSQYAINNYGSHDVCIEGNSVIVTNDMGGNGSGVYCWGDRLVLRNNKTIQSGSSNGFSAATIYSDIIAEGNDFRQGFTTPLNVQSGGSILSQVQNYI